ncbi:MAG: hypothetical protein H0W88_12435 [Parachlamydiaceae bacterium]|nr:hypothetical protein [Parachlamydiaceae bacterium]
MTSSIQSIRAQLSTEEVSKKPKFKSHERANWTPEKDNFVINLFNKFKLEGEKRIFSKICGEFNNKFTAKYLSKQIRERYTNHLDPKYDKTPITKSESDEIANYVLKHGTNWSVLRERLKKPDNMIKNHWHMHLKNKVSGAGAGSTSKPIKAAKLPKSAKPPILSAELSDSEESRSSTPIPPLSPVSVASTASTASAVSLASLRTQGSRRSSRLAKPSQKTAELQIHVHHKRHRSSSDTSIDSDSESLKTEEPPAKKLRREKAPARTEEWPASVLNSSIEKFEAFSNQQLMQLNLERAMSPIPDAFNNLDIDMTPSLTYPKEFFEFN